jgi:hypothetical protein
MLKPVWAVGFALEQTLHVVTLAVFSFLILKRLQHNLPTPACLIWKAGVIPKPVWISFEQKYKILDQIEICFLFGRCGCCFCFFLSS